MGVLLLNVGGFFLFDLGDDHLRVEWIYLSAYIERELTGVKIVNDLERAVAESKIIPTELKTNYAPSLKKSVLSR